MLPDEQTDWLDALGFIVLMLITLALLGFTYTDVAQASERKSVERKSVGFTCKGSPLPGGICHAVYDNAPKVSCVTSRGKKYCAKRSWSRNRKLAFILRRESSFNVCAVSGQRPSCSYQGTNRACGLFQRLPCPQHIFPYLGPEVVNGLGYIVGRYHTLTNAYRFWLSHGWY